MDKVKEELAQEVATKLKELNEVDFLEQLLKDNSSEFIWKEKHYRVRQQTIYDKEDEHKQKMIKYLVMLRDPNYVFKKELLELYKTKNIDIDLMEKQIKQIVLKVHELYKRLNLVTTPKDIQFLEKEITTLEKQQQELFIEKEQLLEFCIETQLDDFVKMYRIFQVLEVKTDETWQKVYKSFDEFKNDTDDILQAKAAQMVAVMVHNEKI